MMRKRKKTIMIIKKKIKKKKKKQKKKKRKGKKKKNIQSAWTARRTVSLSCAASAWKSVCSSASTTPASPGG